MTTYHYFKISLLLFVTASLQAVPANTIVATIPVGVTPDWIALTPDNKYAYVANNNNYGAMASVNGVAVNSDSVSVIDLSTNQVVKTIYDTSFNQPYRIAINAAGTKAYVANSNACTLSIIDIASNIVSGTISGFDGPSGIAITPDGNFAYVNNYGAPCGAGSGDQMTVSVVNLITNTIVDTIMVDLAPAGLAITPDGAYVYVINYVDGNPGTGTINIIRTSDNTVIAPTITGFSGPFAISITPDGNYAYVTNFGSNNFTPYGTTVSKVDLNTNTIVANIDLAIQPAGVGITPDSKYVYATNYNSLYSCLATSSSACDALMPGLGTVNIIDVATNKVLPPTIAVDQSPSSVAIDAKGEFAYVTNYTADTVTVIALQSFQLDITGCKTSNSFLTQIDNINKLTITASGTSLPISYTIYRDAALTDPISTIPATNPTTIFYDHNRTPNVNETYYIVGTNAVETTSAPVSITVTQNC